MTTKIRVKPEYIKSTDSADPQIRVELHFPALLLLKLAFKVLFTTSTTAVHYTLTEDEIELLSRYIVRWRLVKNLRKAKKQHKW